MTDFLFIRRGGRNGFFLFRNGSSRTNLFLLPEKLKEPWSAHTNLKQFLAAKLIRSFLQLPGAY